MLIRKICTRLALVTFRKAMTEISILLNFAIFIPFGQVSAVPVKTADLRICWVLTVEMRMHFTQHPNIRSTPNFATNMPTTRFIEMLFK